MTSAWIVQTRAMSRPDDDDLYPEWWLAGIDAGRVLSLGSPGREALIAGRAGDRYVVLVPGAPPWVVPMSAATRTQTRDLAEAWVAGDRTVRRAWLSPPCPEADRIAAAVRQD